MNSNHRKIYALTENVILQFTDLVTTRRCVLRIDPTDLDLTLEPLLDKYLRHPQLDILRLERRIAEDSEETLTAIQDLVYISSDSGDLTDMFEGVEFLQDGRYLDAEDTPHSEPVTISEKDALVVDLQIDRSGVGYDRNWVGFHRRRWDRHSDVLRRLRDREPRSAIRDGTSEARNRLGNDR